MLTVESFIMYTLTQVLIALPVGTGTVERSFSQMKQIKSRLRNRLSNQIFHHLLKSMDKLAPTVVIMLR